MHPAGSVRAMTRKAVRWIVDPPSRGDLALAAVLLVATAGLVVADAVAAAPALSWDWVDVAGVASTVAVAAAVAVRRTRPLWAGTAATVATTVAYSDGTPLLWIILVAWAMIAFAIGQSATPTTIVLVVAGAWAAETVEAALSGEPFTPVGPALLTVVVLIGSGAVARWRVRSRRRRGVLAQQRAWDDERRAVERERARIARELHDVVAHHVSGIVVSAGAALRVADTGTAAARVTLGTIADSSRRATAAMRTLLGSLDDGQQAALAGLEDLAELVEHAGRTGCRVRLETGGDLGSVPADAGLSAFRIVQEGLTNALKHSGADEVTIRLQRIPTGLDIGVVDSGTGSAGPVSVPVSGHGLIGMAERVALFGGTLDYGPTRDGGWSVRTFLPLA